MDPNTLTLTNQDTGSHIYRTGVGNLSAAATAHTRQPAGHPEGYIETFANIYRNFAMAVKARWGTENNTNDSNNINNTSVGGLGQEGAYSATNNADLYDFPGIEEGIRGMQFIDAVLKSSAGGAVWVNQ